MDRAELYLVIPADYFTRLGCRLRWSVDGEAVEFGDGRTFAFGQEVISFVEGFASQRPLIHFGHILHLLSILRGNWSVPGYSDAARLLHTAFQASGKNYRNAGAVFGTLCGDVPAVAAPPSAAAVEQRTVLRMLGRLFGALGPAFAGEKPVLPPAAFEAAVLRAASALGGADLQHWLCHGRGPVREAGTAVADALRRPPRTLESALADAARRERLAGSAPFVAQLTGALTLPPRRLAPPDLPLGGYADVTTRGGPEQILPSQFALDDLEFVRRCAERELLYYRREEPHARTREDLVVLLDQGVRTWGAVRLVLGAAVFALGRLAGARPLPFRVAATGAGGAIHDPLEMAEDAFAALLEASDLTADPGLALERVLEEEADGARDVVLLTHPRNLAEADVAVAARRLRPGCRLFAVAVDARGDVEFSELRRGVPARLSRFHVDLERTAPPPRQRAEAPDARGPWGGDVEPLPFPFVFGVGAHRELYHFDFDLAGDWLVTAPQGGMLFATRTDGSRVEVLPRPYLDGRLLTNVQRVIGVSGGVVVGGTTSDDVVVVAHYDFALRSCAGHALGQFPRTPVVWYYFPDLHSVVVSDRHCCRAVDLATGGRLLSVGLADARPSRALEACDRVQSRSPAAAAGVRPRRASCILDSVKGEIRIADPEQAWKSFIPFADGRPLLQGVNFMDARRSGWTLAVLGGNGPARQPTRALNLYLFRGPEGAPLAVYPQTPSAVRFTLSEDGRLLARQVDRSRLEVRAVEAGGPPLCATPVRGFHGSAAAVLGDRCLLLHARKTNFLVRWDEGRLTCTQSRGSLHMAVMAAEAARALRPPQAVAADKGTPPSFLAYDPGRFRLTAQGRLIVVVDAYGQTALFEPNGHLVCMFFVYGGQLAAWAPPDVRYGAVRLLGAPATPQADRKVGRALLDAWGRQPARMP